MIGEGDAGNELWFLKVESDSAVDDAFIEGIWIQQDTSNSDMRPHHLTLNYVSFTICDNVLVRIAKAAVVHVIQEWERDPTSDLQVWIHESDMKCATEKFDLEMDINYETPLSFPEINTSFSENIRIEFMARLRNHLIKTEEWRRLVRTKFY